MQTFKIGETTASLRRIYTFLASPSDGYTPVTTALTGATVKLFRNGVALPSGQPTVPASLTHVANGHWYYDIPAIYLDTLGVLTVTIEDASIRPVVLMANVVNYTWTTSTGISAADVWNEILSSYNTNNSAGKILKSLQVLNPDITGQVTTTSPRTTLQFNVNRNDADDTYNSQTIVFSSGNLLGVSTVIRDWIKAGSEATIICDSALPAAPNANSDFYILPMHVHAMPEIANAIWAELSTAYNTTNTYGKILKDLASVYTGVTGLITSTVPATFSSFSTNLTASNETYDEQTIVFTSGACAGQSVPVTEYLQTNGSITTEDPLTSEPQPGDAFSIIPIHVHKRTQIADALLNRLLDSSGSSFDTMNERTVRSALRAMRNRVIVNSGTMSVYKEDDQTVAWEGTLSNTADVTVNPDGGIE